MFYQNRNLKLILLIKKRITYMLDTQGYCSGSVQLSAKKQKK